jgi:hypothetical protein
MAQKCYGMHCERVLISWVSSSGGGLPGRPGLERVSRTLVIFGGLIFTAAQS